MSNYFEILSNSLSSQGIFLAPEQMKELEKSNYQVSDKNPYKFDVFSLGIIILQAATLNLEMEKLFDYENFEINENKIESYLEEVKLRYSDSFSDVLKELLKFSPNSRPDFVEIEKIVTKKFELSKKGLQEITNHAIDNNSS